MTRRTNPVAGLGLGSKIAPPRFIAFLLIMAAAFAVALRSGEWSHAAMIGFDAGALIFLLSCIPLFGKPTDDMRRAAIRNDANRVILLAITAIVCAVILVAVGVELGQKDKPEAIDIGLIIATLLIAWLFSNVVYALHYAHLFYSPKPRGGDGGGIDFPGEGAKEPDYLDFVYFAFTLGMTFQTSDVEISRREVRRVTIFHCLAAFIFNIGVLAFTINVLGG